MDSDPNDKRLVDHFGLAAVLGVSPEKVKALHRAGLLPAYQTGPKQLRFDVDEALATLRVPARITAPSISAIDDHDGSRNRARRGDGAA